ncbi:hypothetical protein AVEN_41722-1 [Araneus ventricosus]|uniref:Uncharacterized protein n=1 Tax=Araneus ventricosus TaxID=182803 RepID=A0A4Y2ABW3_ARAVE|nr:hypothetical protein AVEN_41722-1 [Araneus ventricosus]
MYYRTQLSDTDIEHSEFVHIKITLPWREVVQCIYLNVSRCYSSSVEAGVLVAINGHGPTPLVGGMQYYRQWVGPSRYCAHQGSETQLNYPPASNPRIRGIPQWHGR